ncbi:MAG: hypothetical protein HQK54_13120 [Oligoflexales bacterium]|nr:hypothetical protein [Oligoflexales bacterium]
MAVYLNYYDTYDLFDHEPEGMIRHQLSRRMTPIQRAGVGIFIKALGRHPGQFDSLVLDDGCDLYISTAFGEISSNYSVAHDAGDGFCPVSPKDFQHSVCHATAGYLALTQEIHKNIITLLGGYLSIDKSLYYVSSMMKNRAGRCAVVIHTNEYLWGGTGRIARAEIFLLSGRADTLSNEAAFELMSCEYGFCSEMTDNMINEKYGCVDRVESEWDENKFTYYDMPLSGDSYRRLAVSAGGETVFSEWRRCG